MSRKRKKKKADEVLYFSDVSDSSTSTEYIDDLNACVGSTEKVDKGVWSTGEDKSATKCSWVSEQSDKEMILLPRHIKQVIATLCSRIKDEWQMLLSGQIDEDIILIKDYYIPQQEVSGASVDSKECIDKEMIE